MKKIAIIFLILFLCAQAHAQTIVVVGRGVAAAPAGYTYVSSSSNTGTATDTHIHIAFGASTSSGNLLVVILTGLNYASPAVGSGTFEDDRANTWTRDYIQTDANLRSAIYTAIAKDTGTVTVTATVAGSEAFHAIVAAFNGTANNTPDAAAVNTIANTTNVHAGNLVTSAAGITIGFMRSAAAQTYAVTQDGNWTLIAEREDDPVYSAVYRITTESGTYNDGWTTASGSWTDAVTVGYK